MLLVIKISLLAILLVFSNCKGGTEEQPASNKTPTDVSGSKNKNNKNNKNNNSNDNNGDEQQGLRLTVGKQYATDDFDQGMLTLRHLRLVLQASQRRGNASIGTHDTVTSFIFGLVEKLIGLANQHTAVFFG